MEEDFTLPQFKTLEDADKIMRTPNIMQIPVKKHSKNAWMTLHLEVDLTEEKKELQ
jgi:hypothetical protein